MKSIIKNGIQFLKPDPEIQVIPPKQTPVPNVSVVNRHTFKERLEYIQFIPKTYPVPWPGLPIQPLFRFF